MDALTWDVVEKLLALMVAGATLFVVVLRFVIGPMQKTSSDHERRIVKLETDIKVAVEKLTALQAQEVNHHKDLSDKLTAIQKILSDQAAQSVEFFRKYGVALDYARQQMMKER